MTSDVDGPRISFGKSVPKDVQVRVARWLDGTPSVNAQIAGLRRGRHLVETLSTHTEAISGVMAVVVNAIALVVVLGDRASRHSEQSEWSFARVKALVDDTLASEGVTEVSISQVVGFSEFKSGDSEYCRLTATDLRFDTSYNVYVSRSGSGYVIDFDGPSPK